MGDFDRDDTRGDDRGDNRDEDKPDLARKHCGHKARCNGCTQRARLNIVSGVCSALQEPFGVCRKFRCDPPPHVCHVIRQLRAEDAPAEWDSDVPQGHAQSRLPT
eukprot:gene9421-biopygen4704